MSFSFQDLIDTQDATIERLRQRFAGDTETIEIAMSDSELAILDEAIAGGGLRGKAAAVILADAVAVAEALEKTNSEEASENDSASAGEQTGDAGGRSSGSLKQTTN